MQMSYQYHMPSWGEVMHFSEGGACLTGIVATVCPKRGVSGAAASGSCIRTGESSPSNTRMAPSLRPATTVCRDSNRGAAAASPATSTFMKPWLFRSAVQPSLHGTSVSAPAAQGCSVAAFKATTDYVSSTAAKTSHSAAPEAFREECRSPKGPSAIEMKVTLMVGMNKRALIFSAMLGDHHPILKRHKHSARDLNGSARVLWAYRACLLSMGDPGMRSSESSCSHQPSVRPKVSVRNSVFVVSSLAMSSPPLRSSALQFWMVTSMSRVACSTFVAKSTS